MAMQRHRSRSCALSVAVLAAAALSLGGFGSVVITDFLLPQRGCRASTIASRGTASGPGEPASLGPACSAGHTCWAGLAGLAGTAVWAAWASRAGRRSTPLRAAAARKESVAYEAGQLALLKFEDDGKYYTVKLVKDNGDGTWDITWTEDDAEDTASVENMKPQTKNFKPDDIVVAKCADDDQRYTAKVKKNLGTGFVEVEWMEEGGDETVSLDNMFAQKKKFKEGQAVEAVFPEDGEWYGAKVITDLGKCSFKIEWDEVEEGQDKVVDMFIDKMRVPRVAIETLEIGQKMTGTVGSVREFGAFVDVGCFTDGMIHISKMATKRVDDPTLYCQDDQEVTVWVCSIDTEQNRLGLSLVESKARGGKGKGKGKGKGR